MKYKSTLVPLIIFFMITSSCSSAITIKTIKKNEQKTDPIQTLSNGNILYVGGVGQGNYSNIQDAVDNAYNGDTIFVFNGTYYENIFVDISISLVGENKDNTFIDSAQNGVVVTINADNVNVTGFSIINSTVAASIPGYKPYGIDLYGNNCTIQNNIFIENFFSIHFKKASNCKIIKNTISQNNSQFGVGILLSDSSNIEIKENVVFNSSYHRKFYDLNIFDGIYLLDSDDNIICNNKVRNGSIGIYSKAGMNNKIFKNNISDFKKQGICIKESEKQSILNNSIIGCKNGIYIIENSNENEVGNNRIIGISDKAIYIKDSNRNYIHNNYLVFVNKHCIFLNNCKNSKIYNNLILSSKSGILITKKSDSNNIFENKIEKIQRIGILIINSNQNKIHHNNFKKCLLKAFIISGFFNKWYSNYWGRPRILPKKIFGTGNLLFGRFDWCPRLLPN